MSAEARLEEEKGGDELDAETGELKRSHGVVEDKGLRNDTLVRKHAVFIGERKHFEVSRFFRLEEGRTRRLSSSPLLFSLTLLSFSGPTGGSKPRYLRCEWEVLPVASSPRA